MFEQDFKEIGCIIIPKGSDDKEKFISTCFNEERFWIMTNRNGLLSNVPCIHQVVGDIEFPKDENSFGSQVVVEYIAAYKQWIITGTLSKVGNSSYQSEESLIVRKTFKGKGACGNTVGIIGNSLLSRLAVFCKNLSQKTATLIIECFGDEKSQLELNSSGWVWVKGEKGVKLRYKTEKEINISEDQIQIFFSKEQKLTIKNKELLYEDGKNKFKIDDSGYNLGKINFKDYVTKVLDFLGNDIILLTSMGPTSPGCMASSAASKLIKLKQELAKINS